MVVCGSGPIPQWGWVPWLLKYRFLDPCPKFALWGFVRSSLDMHIFQDPQVVHTCTILRGSGFANLEPIYLQPHLTLPFFPSVGADTLLCSLSMCRRLSKCSFPARKCVLTFQGSAPVHTHEIHISIGTWLWVLLAHYSLGGNSETKLHAHKSRWTEMFESMSPMSWLTEERKTRSPVPTRLVVQLTLKLHMWELSQRSSSKQWNNKNEICTED